MKNLLEAFANWWQSLAHPRYYDLSSIRVQNDPTLRDLVELL